MIERLNDWDTQLFLYLNKQHNTFFDVIMYWASHKCFWLPFYFVLAVFLIRLYKKYSVYILLAIGITITLCDQISSSVIKQTVLRLRPSHEPSLIPYIHLSKAGPGGTYGFVSSHAANATGLTMFLILLLPPKYRNLKLVIIGWALLVCYSRVYNGVHYPLDVIGGIAVGIVSGLLTGIITKKIISKRIHKLKIQD